MTEPTWVREDIVHAVHSRQLAEHGGADGLREPTMLSSALARPINRHLYDDQADLSLLAAASAYGIITNHPFVDGNKRTGFIVASLFLRLNGFRLAASQADKYTTFYNVAAGIIDEPALAQWIREHLRADD